ncbi:MAG: hypothetical protein R3D33_16700 [Hyphomicrobiaceae bacterium]
MTEPVNDPRERWIAIGGAAVFALLLLASLALWLRYGEIVFFTRIMAPIANCL